MIKIANAQFWVHDQDEALSFYIRILGWEVRADVTMQEWSFRWLVVVVVEAADRVGGRVLAETSPPDGPSHLCLLVAGLEARTLDTLSRDERRATLLGALADHLGATVTQPVSWHEKSWHLDPYVGGGYAALPSPDAPASTPDANDPVGPIHWAGTETAREHPGYIEGAIESGRRVAHDVLVALGQA